MDTDCLMLILEHACKKRVHHKATRLHATTAFGAAPYTMGRTLVETKRENDFMRAKGFISSQDTVLVRDTIRTMPPNKEPGFIYCAFADEMQKKTSFSEKYDLVIVDAKDYDWDKYDEYRVFDGEELPDDEESDESEPPENPKRLPCLGWGVRESRTYTLAPSRDIRVSVAIDVVVIPTSWWFDECQESRGDWAVIQIVKGKRASNHTLCLEKEGYTRTQEQGPDLPFVLGWIEERG